jgi:hypothetical protein
MPTEETARASALIAQLRVKMRKLADEFASGEINREQFHRIYEHYQAQLNLASSTLTQSGDQKIEGIPAGQTILLRRQLTAVAKAAMVYHHASGQILEIIGDQNVPTEPLMPSLAALAEQVQEGVGTEPLPDPQVMMQENDWVLLVPGEFSTAVMVFNNEPVSRQIEIVLNMHRDFEVANDAALRSGQTQAAKLVYPFIGFVRRSVTRPGAKQ